MSNLSNIYNFNTENLDTESFLVEVSKPENNEYFSRIIISTNEYVENYRNSMLKLGYNVNIKKYIINN